MIKKHLPYWLFLISLIVVLVIRELLKDGMFMDGMIYVCVGKNLANGGGTFWHPTFGQVYMNIYHEQPPLLFGIEALFFKVLGNSMYVERFYCFLTMLITILLMVKIWKTVVDEKYKDFAWLPILLWIIFPVCFWAYVNCVEENTMGVFVLLAILYCIKLVQNECSVAKTIYYLSVIATALIASSLCKGFQGLFPIAFFFFYWLVIKKISFKKMFFYSSYLVAFITLFYLIIISDDTVYSSFELYFKRRLVSTFNNEGATTDYRFDLMFKLILDALPSLGLIFILTMYFRFKKVIISAEDILRKNANLFLLIGLAGSVPLMATLEQRKFYLVTTLPYFAIALAMISVPYFLALHKHIQQKEQIVKLTKISAVILFMVLAFTTIDVTRGVPKRDKDMLHDVHLLGKIIPANTVVSCPDDVFRQWNLQAYFNRYYDISFDFPDNKRKYYLSEQTIESPDLINVPLELKKFKLYIRKDN